MASPESAEPNRFFAQFAAFVALGVGMLVFIGWTFEVMPLVNLVPGWPMMAKLAAATFIVAGAALWLVSIRAGWLAPISAALVASVGVAVLLRNLMGWDVSLAMSAGLPITPMASATAIAFLLFGASLLCARVGRLAHLHQALAILCLLMGWLGLSRYVFDSDSSFQFASMAVHAALLLILLLGGRSDAAARRGHRRIAGEQGRGRRHGAPPVAGRDRRPAARGRDGHPLRTQRRRRHRARRLELRVAERDRVRRVRVDQRRARRARGPARAAKRKMHCGSPRSATSSSSRPRSTPSSRWIVTVSSRGWNTQAESMFGWTRADAMGRELAELIIPVRAPRRSPGGHASLYRIRRGPHAEQAHRDARAPSPRVTSFRWSSRSRRSVSATTWCSAVSFATSRAARARRPRCAKASSASERPRTPRRC